MCDYQGTPEPLHITANCLDVATAHPINRDQPANTRDLYKCVNVPKRYESPNVYYGYGSEHGTTNILYRTSNSEYGWYSPSVHTVPVRYFPQNHKFTSQLWECTGSSRRNFGLNTSMDKSYI